MKLHQPRPLSGFSPPGLRRFIHLAERAAAQLSAMSGSVEIRIGEPAFRIGLPVEIVRDALVRQIDDARASLARTVLR